MNSQLSDLLKEKRSQGPSGTYMLLKTQKRYENSLKRFAPYPVACEERQGEQQCHRLLHVKN